MHDKDDIISILNAVNEINVKPKKKNIISTPVHNPAPKRNQDQPIPKLNQDQPIPTDVDKLIREAEKYKVSRVEVDTSSATESQKNQIDEGNILILTDEVLNDTDNKNIKILESNIEIKNFKKIEKELRLKIDNLENEVLQFKKKVNYMPSANQSLTDYTAENLKVIYKQIEDQKKIFLDLKKYSIKTERESYVYKENYERLIIENNSLKTRLKIAKEQIVSYEANKVDLLSALDQLNNILSKSNIAGKISPQNPSFDKIVLKKETKIETSD